MSPGEKRPASGGKREGRPCRGFHNPGFRRAQNRERDVAASCPLGSRREGGGAIAHRDSRHGFEFAGAMQQDGARHGVFEDMCGDRVLAMGCGDGQCVFEDSFRCRRMGRNRMCGDRVLREFFATWSAAGRHCSALRRFLPDRTGWSREGWRPASAGRDGFLTRQFLSIRFSANAGGFPYLEHLGSEGGACAIGGLCL